MSGYRGDGYGQYGNVGDDGFGWGERENNRPRGAAQGNLMGWAERDARSFFSGDDDGRDREPRNLADDPRAVRAAEEWRQRFGREGYEGSYAQHDEPYRSYRERHLAELDNDYAEYCRENGHEFSSAFETWRQGRQGGAAVPAMANMGGAPEAGLTDGPTAALGEEPVADAGLASTARRGTRKGR
ncbi:MAG TPA: hypothetical protein VM913_01225 [Sphingomicrobium sp.]|nr:hypothetical protein [Sphingomicrobium sp.]